MIYEEATPFRIYYNRQKKWKKLKWKKWAVDSCKEKIKNTLNGERKLEEILKTI